MEHSKTGHSRATSYCSLASPTTPHFRLQARTATSKLHLPTQIRRCLPLYSAFIIILIVSSNLFSIHTSSPNSGGEILTRRHLAMQKTISETSKDELFPRKLWQTWKDGPLNFEEKYMTCARTWIHKNPGHRYEVLTDDNDLEYIELHYGPTGLDRPDITELYRSINTPIVKADLLRYLIMYAEGGVYADIDVEALKPVNRFIPERYDEHEIDMVIGVEIDQPEFKDHAVLGKKSQSFCQWTFLCKPQLPVMMRLIESIMSWLEEVAARQGVPISDIVLDFNEVISGTGPSAFTTAILAEMTAGNAGKPISWDIFHNMGESKLVNGILVLTVEAFAAGQGHSDSGNHNARTALVKHHYHASGWPSKHPRYSHPIYGSVETCNWVPPCVSRWDSDVASFNYLPPEEQARYIAVKEKAARLAKQDAENRAKEEADAKGLAELAAFQQSQEAIAAAVAAQIKQDEDLRIYAQREAQALVEADLKQVAEAEAGKRAFQAGKRPEDIDT